MKKYTKGFTLIELLVVIAIIGILSSVVLVSLNTARQKGADAKVQAQVGAARAAAEIYYSNNQHYSPAGTAADSCAAGMFADATSNFATYTTASNYPNGTTFLCRHNAAVGSAASAYAFAAKLSTGANDYQCIDSTGQAVKITAALASGDVTCL